MIENIIWIMGIGMIGIILFRTFVNIEMVKYAPEPDELAQSVLKDKVLMKTMEELLKSNKLLTKQIDNINKQLETQKRINNSSNKIFENLVLRMKQLEDLQLKLLKKHIE